jgi:hypothetical protein
MLHRVLIPILLLASMATAQDNGGNNGNGNGNGNATAFGVWIDTAGVLRHREADSARELAALRSKRPSPKEPALKFVSLVKTVAGLKQGEADRSVAHLGGIQQLQYVIVDAENKDLLLGGPAEEIDFANPLQPRGKTSGRPVLHFDDFAAAMRVNRGGVIGCSIDPPDHALQKGQEVLKRVGQNDRKLLMSELATALGPQKIRVFGVAPESRVAFVALAADYKLKRYSLGLEPVPLSGVGNPIDSSRDAGNAYWFEAAYDPMLVSEDGLVYHIRGPRLRINSGKIPFDDKGATERAKAWAKTLSTRMPQLAANMPIVADLQNATDLALLAEIIRADDLKSKVAADWDWLAAYNPLQGPTPKHTDTLVNITNGAVAAGGVSLKPGTFLDGRETDRKQVLEPIRRQAKVY